MFTLPEVILVACGGAFGAISRFAVGRLSENFLTSLTFPLATLFINVLGCFLIGFVSELSLRGALSPHLRLLIVTGVLGGFTTFSAFGLETFALLRSGHLFMALTYVIASVIGGTLATYAGFLLLATRQ